MDPDERVLYEQLKQFAAEQLRMQTERDKAANVIVDKRRRARQNANSQRSSSLTSHLERVTVPEEVPKISRPMFLAKPQSVKKDAPVVNSTINLQVKYCTERRRVVISEEKNGIIEHQEWDKYAQKMIGEECISCSVIQKDELPPTYSSLSMRYLETGNL